MTNNSKRIPYCDRKTETWSIGAMCPPTGFGARAAPLSVGPALTFRPSTFLFKIFPADYFILITIRNFA